MKSLTLQIELLTPCLIGSGAGYSPLIDTDIVFDEMGIPFIPAKRIKGCLRDSALEICQSLKKAGIRSLAFSDNSDGKNLNSLITKIFGCPGSEEPAGVYFSNLYVSEYKAVSQWLVYITSITPKDHPSDEKKGQSLINRESIINYFTEIRQQTAIDSEKGVAKEHSLRTIRVLKKGLKFIGSIELEEDTPEVIALLSLAVKNLKHIGTKRTRGFGYVSCKLFDNDKELNYIHKLEVIWTS